MDDDNMNKRYVSVAKAAAIAGCCTRSILRLFDRGVLTKYNPPGLRAVRVDHGELRAWLAKGGGDGPK
ncbi:MAG: helix-turn-helix transcriptional regulator [Acidiphilium sp.]